MRPDIPASGVLRIEHADMELVDDQIIECWRSEPRIVPGIIGRVTHNAVAVGVPVKFQFARIRITLEALTARSDDVKAVEIAIPEARYESGPESIGILDEQIAFFFLKRTW
jgi:hypothetical protein